MAKVLLVDTNFSSRPIYDTLERRGHEVHVVGGNPADCLAKSCRWYWPVNYADTAALAELVAREGFDHLVPGCTDRSYTACALVSQGRFAGIDPVAVDEALNHKDRFRALAHALGLPVPQVQWQDAATFQAASVSHAWRWPLVVKPVDAFSGKGVTILHNPDTKALQAAMATARSVSARGRCLVEDYVQGQLHSHSAFLQQGRVVHDVFVEEHCTANPFVVDTSRVLHAVAPPLRAALRQAIETLADALDLGDGLVHTQFILDGTQAWLIELTRRCPGDLYSQLVELSGLHGYVDRYVAPFLGQPFPTTSAEHYVPMMRHTVTVPAAQGFSHLQFHQPVHIERWVPLSLTGDPLQASPASRIGILFARAADEPQLAKLYTTTMARQLYDVVH